MEQCWFKERQLEIWCWFNKILKISWRWGLKFRVWRWLFFIIQNISWKRGQEHLMLDVDNDIIENKSSTSLLSLMCRFTKSKETFWHRTLLEWQRWSAISNKLQSKVRVTIDPYFKSLWNCMISKRKTLFIIKIGLFSQGLLL